MPFTVGSNTKGDVPAGTYTATLESISITNIVSSFSPAGKDMREWHFLANVNGELKPISGLTSLSTGPASKSYRFLEALLRRPLKAGEAIDDPVGQQVTIVVGMNAKGYPQVTDLLPANVPDTTTLPDGSVIPR